MKKIFVLIVLALTVISCLNSGSFSQSYTADITFEFSDNVYKNSFKDSLYIVPDGEGFLYMQYPVSFSQKQLAGNLQGGFLMSCLKGEKDNALDWEPAANDAYRVHAAAGAQNSKTYTVFYDNPVESMMPAHDIEFGYKDVGTFSPYGCYVNNSTLVARKIKEHFVDGDKLVLKAIGLKGDGTKVEASITLAEYTEAKDTVMYNWSVFDLSKFGDVDYIDFEVKSTNPDVPEYFCMDGFLAGIQVEY